MCVWHKGWFLKICRYCITKMKTNSLTLNFDQVTWKSKGIITLSMQPLYKVRWPHVWRKGVIEYWVITHGTKISSLTLNDLEIWKSLGMDNYCTKFGNSQAYLGVKLSRQHLYQDQQFDLDLNQVTWKSVGNIYSLRAATTEPSLAPLKQRSKKMLSSHHSVYRLTDCNTPPLIAYHSYNIFFSLSIFNCFNTLYTVSKFVHSTFCT